MTILEHLHVFDVGDKVTAEETNDNNETLEYWINDHTAVNNYIDGKITELNNTYSSQIEGINSQISGVNQQINTLNNSAITYINTSGKGGARFQNGWAINWGPVNFTGTQTVSLTFDKAFKDTSYVPVGSWNAAQVAGDKRMNWRIVSKNTGSLSIATQVEGTNSQSGKIFIIAVGKWK